MKATSIWVSSLCYFLYMLNSLHVDVDSTFIFSILFMIHVADKFLVILFLLTRTMLRVCLETNNNARLEIDIS